MAKITYVQPDDRAQTFDVPAGYSVMEGAFRNNVEGIIAECGGKSADNETRLWEENTVRFGLSVETLKGKTALSLTSSASVRKAPFVLAVFFEVAW